MLQLNARALSICDASVAAAEELRIAVDGPGDQGRVLDFGVAAPGGLRAGLRLAEICLAGLAQVRFIRGEPGLWPGPAVLVETDHPTAACMASQYAGWQIAVGKYFAMGSGPMRCVARKEPLFERLAFSEQPTAVVGVLESGKLPAAEVVAYVAEHCRVAPAAVTLCVARTASLAGTIQVTARTVETAMHKLVELGFPAERVRSGIGIAPLPPPGRDDLASIGLTNDAILYGGQVWLWVEAEDDQIAAIGPRVPSNASSDHGAPFAQIFERYNRNFYEIDPLLFSPAQVTFHNLSSGRTHVFGATAPSVLQKSFSG